MKRHFGTIKVIGEFREKKLPVLLVSNHTSWWDGFWAMYLTVKIFKRKFHFMMLEDQLRKFWFFNYTGGFSVNKKSRSIVETINYTVELLADNKNMVLIFPQGEIQTMHNQSFLFENGIERILKKRKGPVQTMFLACIVDYFSSKKPGIYLYLEEYSLPVYDIASIQCSYNEFYSQCLDKQRHLTIEK